MLKESNLTVMFHNVTQGIVNTLKGYSPEDINAAKRVIDGSITLTDRQKFLEDETLRISSLVSPGYDITHSLNNPPAPLLGVSFLLDEVRRIGTLSQDQLDQQIITQAKERLTRWGQI